MVVFRSDPCGIFCILLTYGAVFYADYVVTVQIVMPTMSNSLWGAFNAVLFNVILTMMLASHLRAVLSDPGVVPLPKTNLDFSDLHSGSRSPIHQSGHDWTVCARCETYRPPRAHHCRICRRCIRRMDHHCPWINNCVGEYNQKYFLQFIIYVGIASVHAIVLVAVAWLGDCDGCQLDEHSKQTMLMHCIILVIESLLFGIFVVAIMVDQLTAIWTDETAVEQVQRRGPHRPLKSKMALLQEVFGRGSLAFWLLPCHSPPKEIEPHDDYTV
ncbi:PREDICTED: palmitoyltransferase ZDHHC3-like [Priapulus caudatus]|uniref:Palmitoyltransferase n=1 Tax=Priapulus caudatus TaxID=37621 RepID=A0ABM1DRK5_PRICU|nr:PREDICTED: palmitoyltransferase ZDHHC3-like [Priapulus caudatus]